MTTIAPEKRGILLVDDGELDEVARVLESEGVPYERLRGGGIPDEIDPPRDLLIVTPRRVEQVRPGSPAGAKPGRPLRIIALKEDSPAMRRRLRRSGLHLLIRLPAEAEVWRLLIARALYKGSERREDPRVAVGSPVALQTGTTPPKSARRTLLIDLSNRGCRLQTEENLSVGDPIEMTLPGLAEVAGENAQPLTLRGEVRRLVTSASAAPGEAHMLAVVFDSDLPDDDRSRLTSLINHWASGPQSLDAPRRTDAPAIPACQLASLPDLTLDDETDPPVHAESEVPIELGTPHGDAEPAAAPDRRNQTRGQFETPVAAETEEGPFVLIGRDLSPGGMRIERHPDLRVGDRFRVSLREPGAAEPFLVGAEIIRDDGEDGFGLAFTQLEPELATSLEKMVATLPDVESLEDGEIAGLGAILSEILPIV